MGSCDIVLKTFRKIFLFLVLLVSFWALIGIFLNVCYGTFDFTYNGTTYHLPDLPETQLDNTKTNYFNPEAFNIMYGGSYDGKEYTLITYVNFSPNTYYMLNTLTNQNATGALGIARLSDGLSGSANSGATTRIWFANGSDTSWTWHSSYQPGTNSTFAYYSGRLALRYYIYSTHDVYYATLNNNYATKNSLYFQGTNSVVAPMVVNINDISENPNWQYFYINPGSVSATSPVPIIYMYLTEDSTGQTLQSFVNVTTDNYIEDNGQKLFYIPKSAFPDFSFDTNESYTYVLHYWDDNSNALSTINYHFTITYDTTTPPPAGSVDLSKIEGQLNDIDSSLNDVNSALKDGFANLQEALENNNSGLAEGFQGVSDSIDNMAEQMGELNNTMNEVNSSVQQVGEAVDKVNESITETNDFLQDSSFSQDSITDNMPSNSSVNDTTSASLDNIFTMLRNSFTGTDLKDFVFVVPFSEQEIVIPYDITLNIVPDVIKNLIQMVYYFVISRFIYKDIVAYFDKMKSGDIVSATDTNIKADML